MDFVHFTSRHNVFSWSQNGGGMVTIEGSLDFQLATGQGATENNKINYEVIQVAK